MEFTWFFSYGKGITVSFNNGALKTHIEGCKLEDTLLFSEADIEKIEYAFKLADIAGLDGEVNYGWGEHPFTSLDVHVYEQGRLKSKIVIYDDYNDRNPAILRGSNAVMQFRDEIKKVLEKNPKFAEMRNQFEVCIQNVGNSLQ